MATTRPRVYADACVYVSVLKAEPGHEMARSVLEAAERKDIELVASRFLPIEVGAWRADGPSESAAADFVERFLNSVDVEWVEVDLIAVRDSRRIAWSHKLRAADSLHLATAARRKVDYFMTSDTDFPIDTEVEGVRIVRPRIVWNPTLTDGEPTAKAS